MVITAVVALLALVVGACGDLAATPTEPEDGGTPTATQPSGGGQLSGQIAIAGSSTVFPINEAMGEEFSQMHSDVRVNVASTGSGAGIEAFCSGEIPVAGASRPIRQSELETCAAAGYETIELPVAFDALSVVVSPDNDWVDCLSVEELATIFGPEAQGTVTNWNQVREGFPDAELHLFGPTTASGTFDYFTEAIMGESGAHRGDLDLATEEDPLIAQGVDGTRGGIGYFGLAYLEQYRDLVKPLGIRNPDTGECVEPAAQTVEEGSYQPLARPIFIYVRGDLLDQQSELEAFVEFYLENAPELVPEVGYVTLPQEGYDWGMERVQNRTSGSVFSEVEPGTPFSEVLERIE